MWWIPLATAAVSAYMGNQQQKAQTDARKEQARFNAWAPLFGQAPKPLGAEQDQVTPAILQGAMSGYQMMAQHQMNQKLGNYYDKMSAKDTANPNASTQAPLLSSLYQQPMTYDSRRVDPETYFNMYGMS
ncbi:MAG TPA: hypothetical protein VE954_43120 [Oligoflexus sp.]|uniref:hypothetical protein n=1 Tax=Oligoflexus sp. TaxID=1971216 RepID=UPI002D3B6FB0|nr:hypothetical protein [Oligoflexus sp.]HYX39936.1 hypothetical protein [Oligoflexus sp.]